MKKIGKETVGEDGSGYIEEEVEGEGGGGGGRREEGGCRWRWRH